MKVGDMKFSENEIVTATKGNLVYSNNTREKVCLSTDSRSIKENELYIPIKGENFNGHDFIKSALENGCSGFIIESSELYRLKDLPQKGFAIEVKNTKEAYLALGEYYKNLIKPIVIGITGSSGKTTTKEMIAKVLEAKYKIHKTKLNHNNEIGMAQTMLEMKEDTEVLILEMGMRAKGEIELLSKYASPDLAVITNIGLAHIGLLGSQKEIAKAKCEIIKHLHPEGWLIACDSPFLEKYATNCNKICYSLGSPQLKNIKKNSNFTAFEYKKHPFELNVTGDYNILNALCAIEIGQKLGLSNNQIAEQLKKYEPLDDRGKTIQINNLNFITDYYNANPESMKASILSALESYNPIGLVLGDMGELGKQAVTLHKEIGELLQNKNISHLITIGKLSKYISKNSQIENARHFKTTDKAIKYLRKIKEPCTLLLKASRSMKFEEIIEQLKGQPAK